jgi:hypothetical protein
MRVPHRYLAAVAAGLLALCLPHKAAADPICCGAAQGATLADDYTQASIVLLGRFTNAKPGENLHGGTSDFVIETVFKKHPLIAGKERITLPKYLPSAEKKTFLIFCDVYKGAIDAYRGVEVVPGSELLKYFRGSLLVQGRPLSERLRFAFDYLNSSDLEIALDAMREYAQSTYKDYRTMAKRLPADKLVRWLSDPKTPLYRYGLYSMLLGECGTAKDGLVFRQLMDDPKKRPGGGVEGILLGYLFLQPEPAWAYLRSILGDSKEEWLMRYSALRTVRFLWDQRPDLIAKEKLVDAVGGVLAHMDMADIAIEDLRKWQRWEFGDRILSLFDKEGYDAPIIRRAILRYALCCPGSRAAAFIREQRRLDPELINDLEELLKLESAPKAP